MTLTTEQRAAVHQGQAVAVDIDGDICIVIRKDIFELSGKPLDCSDMDPAEAYDAIEAAWGDDPGLDVYQDYK